MEKKHFKPVPDVEALRYKGTPETPDIKIFVSHRIDQDSETIDNPLYIPVRCGAVFDEREGVTMLGDDTGDNISEKSKQYTDLAVLYWAWKNIDADYYGFCNNKEYLAFDAPIEEKNTANNSTWKNYTRIQLNRQFQEDYGLNNKNLWKTIVRYDVVVPGCIDVKEESFIKEYYKAMAYTLDTNDLDCYLNIVKEVVPDIYAVAKNRIEASEFRYYFAFIMNKKQFNCFCNYLFSILSLLCERTNMTQYSLQRKQTFLMYAAILFLDAYIVSLQREYQKEISLLELPVVVAENCDKQPELIPAFEKENVPIVLLCSNEYVPYLSVYLRSLLDHVNESKNYDLIVLQKSITDRNKSVLKAMCKDFPNVSIRFYNPKGRLNGASFYIAQKEYCEEAYYRLFAPWYMAQYDKAIVMDCDILVRKDLAELFDIDLEGNYAAGVIDAVFQGMLNGWAAPDTLEYALNEMEMKNPRNYLNTGVMLFDFQKIRENFTEESLVKLSETKKLRCQEQDILNIILEGHVKFLSLKWNCYVRSGDFVIYGLKWAPESVFEEFNQAVENPYIVHFVAYPKPWLDPTIEFGQEFWSTAQRTPFYETILFLLMENRYGGPIFSLQSQMGVWDTRTNARKFADKWLPPNSRRRALAKKIAPRGSLLWRFMKQIQYLLHPEYRPAKSK